MQRISRPTNYGETCNEFIPFIVAKENEDTKIFSFSFSPKYMEHDHDSRNMNLETLICLILDEISKVITWPRCMSRSLSLSLSLSLARSLAPSNCTRQNYRPAAARSRAVFSRPSQEYNRNLNYLGKLLRENQLYSAYPENKGRNNAPVCMPRGVLWIEHFGGKWVFEKANVTAADAPRGSRVEGL